MSITNEELALQGDSTALELLYTNNKKLIIKTCYPFINARNTIEDLQQEAYFALLKAVSAYNAGDKQLKFTTYLTKAMQWHLIRLYQQDKNKQDRLELDELISEGDSQDTRKSLLADDAAVDEFDKNLSKEALSDVFTVVQNMLGAESTEYKIIYEWFNNNKTFEQIGLEIDMPGTRVGQTKDRAIKKIRHKHNRQLYELYEDVVSGALKRSGFSYFKNTGMSSVEWAVMELERKRERQERIKRDMIEHREKEQTINRYILKTLINRADAHTEKGQARIQWYKDRIL